MLKVHSEAYTVIHKFCPYQFFHSNTILYLLHHCGQYIVRALKGYTRSRRTAGLTNDPASWARVAVKHAGNTEEAEELVQLSRCVLRCAGEEIVESLRVKAGDLIILTAMINHHLAASFLELREIVGPSPNV